MKSLLPLMYNVSYLYLKIIIQKQEYQRLKHRLYTDFKKAHNSVKCIIF